MNTANLQRLLILFVERLYRLRRKSWLRSGRRIGFGSCCLGLCKARACEQDADIPAKHNPLRDIDFLRVRHTVLGLRPGEKARGVCGKSSRSEQDENSRLRRRKEDSSPR